MFEPLNVETTFEQAHDLSGFLGLETTELVRFHPERLIIHELLIRVTADLSVPDGPEYEELGINLRSMTRTVYDNHITPELPRLRQFHETYLEQVQDYLQATWDHCQNLASARRTVAQNPDQPWWKPWKKSSPERKATRSEPLGILELLNRKLESENSAAQKFWLEELINITRSCLNRQGRIPADGHPLVDVSITKIANRQGSRRLGDEIAPIIKIAAIQENYRLLPPQEKPLVLNVKGASAAGKSTIRPQQRDLAASMGKQWEEFALISPDYWRKYLLDYDSLGSAFKYGAMLTGHELAIIDGKLDRYMTDKARNGSMPHLLIDRFRFDSFQTSDQLNEDNRLLSRFGDSIYMFFMITPPTETVERAWKRGLTTGRYKAVDDLLDHNVEAYSGMPGLFLSWALSDKSVHFEFLDNSVQLGEQPKTAAFGCNKHMVVLDVTKMLDVERYKRINIDASDPDHVYDQNNWGPENNTSFIERCAVELNTLTFASQQTGEVWGVFENGNWVYCDPYFSPTDDENAVLDALNWPKTGVKNTSGVETQLTRNRTRTLGSWAGF